LAARSQAVLQFGDARLCVCKRMFLHDHCLRQKIRRRRKRCSLRPDQLFSLRILRRAIGLPQSLKQIFDQILFVWSHTDCEIYDPILRQESYRDRSND
jgi:hypothetical protein